MCRARSLQRLWPLLVAALLFVPAAGASDSTPTDLADETYDCGYLGLDSSGLPACLDGEPDAAAARVAESASAASAVSALETEDPPSCRIHVEAVFWTASDWVRLGNALAADPSPCADYWISIPPLAADKTRLRVLQDDVIRALGPRFHPVAEMTLGDATGWANWVKNNNKTWFEAGVEFRRRMAAAGYQFDAGETWLLNEFDRSTRRDAEREPIEPSLLPYRRADMRELVRGLYTGDAGMPTSAGIAEIGISFSHQNLPDVVQYKQEMKAWLEDSAFWADMNRYVRWLAREAYPDTRLWGVPGSSRPERGRHLQDYIFHLLELARSGTSATATARDYFEHAYLPLANAAWRGRGGDQFQFVTGHGNTIVSADTMQHFVSEQVRAIREYAGAHPQGAPAGRLGFSWQPCNRSAATEPGCKAPDASFLSDLDAISARVAAAIHYAYRQGAASPAGACSPPGSEEEWCNGAVEGAAFTEAWDGFDSWN
jgi:hypothetical protein